MICLFMITNLTNQINNKIIRNNKNLINNNTVNRHMTKSSLIEDLLMIDHPTIQDLLMIDHSTIQDLMIDHHPTTQDLLMIGIDLPTMTGH